MKKFKDLDIVALTENRQTTHFETKEPITLYKGQVGTIIMEYDGEVFEVEFSNNDGTTYAMETIPANQLINVITLRISRSHCLNKPAIDLTPMTVIQNSSLTLETFLKQPETKPAKEYIDGDIIEKPMPKARRSRLQGKLIYHINEVAEKSQLAYAFPELRCTFGGRSIVPDIAVLYWQNIAVDENGEPKDNILIAPNWTIEILSPEQSSNRVTNNILHCLKYGCQLGWLIDPDDRSILVFQPEKQPEFCHRNDSLLILDGIDLTLTVEQVFDWLKMNVKS